MRFRGWTRGQSLNPRSLNHKICTLRQQIRPPLTDTILDVLGVPRARLEMSLTKRADRFSCIVPFNPASQAGPAMILSTRNRFACRMSRDGFAWFWKERYHPLVASLWQINNFIQFIHEAEFGTNTNRDRPCMLPQKVSSYPTRQIIWAVHGIATKEIIPLRSFLQKTVFTLTKRSANTRTVQRQSKGCEKHTNESSK